MVPVYLPLIVVLLVMHQWLRRLCQQELLLLLLSRQHLFAEDAVTEAIYLILLFVRQAGRRLEGRELRWYVTLALEISI